MRPITGPADVGHAAQAWLCILPASARRFRVSDPLLGTAIRTSGADLVEGSPDVEIGPPEELLGDADVGVVSIGSPGWVRGPLPARVAKRSLSNTRMRVEARRAARQLRRLGYPRTDVATWDLGHQFRVRGILRDAPSARSAVEHLPQCALVFGRRDAVGESLVEAAIRDAGAAVGSRLRQKRLCARGGLALAFTDRGLVRVSVGPGRRQIRAQSSALRVLQAADLPESVVRRVPWQEAQGSSNIAVWAFEHILPGDAPRRALSKRLMEECLEFLVALHSVKGGAREDTSLSAAASLVARVCGPAEAAVIEETGPALDAALAGVPRGFGHGDFSLGNLLTRDEELLGVVDWDSAGPDRLAMLDAIHLAFTSRHRPTDMDWGRKLVRDVIPWARCGGDDLTNGYCRHVGIDPDPELLELLVIAYWLDRSASQLRTHAERWEDRAWIHANIEHVARAIAVRGGVRWPAPALKISNG